MIVDNEERVVRYVEIDGNGIPSHANCHTHIGGVDEETWFTNLVAAAANNGHTIVRLCNHADDCRNPGLDTIESNGRGGIKEKPKYPDALANSHVWNAAQHERKFVQAHDEGADVTRVIRMEPGQWTQAQLDDGYFVVTKAGIFEWRANVTTVPHTPKETKGPADISFRGPSSGGSFRGA